MEEKLIACWLLNPDSPTVFGGLDLETVVKRLKELDLEKIYQKIELPLQKILREMHERGVALDLNFLKNTKKQLDNQISQLTSQIYKEAGGNFNINSPKQLLSVLFDRLKILPRLRSTAAGQLILIKRAHPIISLVLDYREAFKLSSTYVEPFLKLGVVVRTTFLQTGTATGRLSSQNPNLQNIPEIIKPTFVARSGYHLASFDYSQIELRVLANVAHDQKMIEAFKDDVDIHQLTASQVFNVALDSVTKEMRQLAKTLNFGVIYGMGAIAFAKNSGLSVKEARRFIDEYFQDFAQIKDWQENTIKETKAKGYAENLNGRKRWLPAINSQDQKISSEAARAAINMPIQSLAADIIKLAMIATQKFRLLLSIHDELLFEIEDDRLKESVAEIKQAMESVYELAVPLRVNVKVGNNWGNLKNYVV